VIVCSTADGPAGGLFSPRRSPPRAVCWDGQADRSSAIRQVCGVVRVAAGDHRLVVRRPNLRHRSRPGARHGGGALDPAGGLCERLKLTATVVSYVSGIPGGNFAPSLFLRRGASAHHLRGYYRGNDGQPEPDDSADSNVIPVLRSIEAGVPATAVGCVDAAVCPGAGRVPSASSEFPRSVNFRTQQKVSDLGRHGQPEDGQPPSQHPLSAVLGQVGPVPGLQATRTCPPRATPSQPATPDRPRLNR
jgi:hypothetical protein